MEFRSRPTFIPHHLKSRDKNNFTRQCLWAHCQRSVIFQNDKTYINTENKRLGFNMMNIYIRKYASVEYVIRIRLTLMYCR